MQATPEGHPAGNGHVGHHNGSSVPDIPGDPVVGDQLRNLRSHVSALCGLGGSIRFPGAQPVSFVQASIDALMNEDFWVCEKTDGQRVLILIIVNPVTKKQEVFLIDRKNEYRQLRNLYFPKPKGHPDQTDHANNTLLDGELVWDTEPSGKRKLRLYLFDAIIMQCENIMAKPLDKRYGRLKQMLYQPFFDYMVKHPEAVARAPFEIKVKNMDLSYSVEHVIKEKIPQLKHGNDGLIFTCFNSSYKTGTDPKILKWKPPSENTVDFKLRLRFPPDLEADPTGRTPDLTAKPFCQLDQWMGRASGGGRGPRDRSGAYVGDDAYEYFDWLDLSDDEWERMKASGIPYNDCIVECAWVVGGEEEIDSRTGATIVRPPRWVMKRIRDDKTDGNHSSVVKSVLKSIQDGVEEDELIKTAPAMRAAWKSATRTCIREGRIVYETGPDGRLFDVVLGPQIGGPGPPMREGGSVKRLRRR